MPENLKLHLLCRDGAELTYDVRRFLSLRDHRWAIIIVPVSKLVDLRVTTVSSAANVGLTDAPSPEPVWYFARAQLVEEAVTVGSVAIWLRHREGPGPVVGGLDAGRHQKSWDG